MALRFNPYGKSSAQKQCCQVVKAQLVVKWAIYRIVYW